MPGPPIVACKGDHIVVDVVNKMHSRTTSVNFHGNLFLHYYFSCDITKKISFYLFSLQLTYLNLGEHFRDGFQYYGGVPFITQCPIYPLQR